MNKIFVVFFLSLCVTTVTYAQVFTNLQPYSDHDLVQIQQTVLNAVTLDPAKLAERSPSDHFSAQTLANMLSSGQDFTAYGKTMEQAEVKSSLMCIRYFCEQIDAQVRQRVEQLKQLPAEQLMDIFRTTGKLNSLPPEVRNDASALKDYIANRPVARLSCSDPSKTELRTQMYIQCVSAGYTGGQIKESSE